MSQSQASPISELALECFARWQAERDAGRGGSLEELLDAHPALAADLRRLDQHWREAEHMFAGLAADSVAWHSALRSLGAAPGPLDPRSSALLERLTRIRPTHARYTLEGVLAEGGMGVVLRARDGALGRELAMKVLRGAEHSRASGGLLRRFLNEAQLLGRLEHPSIVPVHDLGVDDGGRPFFTMPWVRGERLLDVLAKHGVGAREWPQARVIEVLLKVCDALAYAHERGVVHRDLKPENVMVGRFGEVYVMDWGLARVRGLDDEQHGEEARAGTSAMTLVGDVLGTPAYMAPEQADRIDALDVDERADVYALGAILYHLLAGVRPYCAAGESPTARETLERVRGGPPAELEAIAPHAAPELVAIQRRAMARQRTQRYASMLELAADLRAFVDGRVVRAHEQGAWAELRKWVRRNKSLALTFAAAATIAAAAALLVIAAERRRSDEARLAFEDAKRRLDAASMQRLHTEVDELWPVTPENAPRMEHWVTEARAILALVPQYRRELVEIRTRALEPSADDRDEEHERATINADIKSLEARMRGLQLDIADMEDNATGVGREQGLAWTHSRLERLTRAAERLRSQLRERRSWRFASQVDAERHASLRTVVELSELFADDFDGSLSVIESRAERAQTLRERSIDNRAAEWTDAVAAIADRTRCPLYGGLRIRPQTGLVPLGSDPDSGLWEFAHLESGEMARRGADGRLELRAETGIVLVLIPPGMLSEPRVELDAFFLSKYEVTQGQWVRVNGENPSYFSVGTDWAAEICPTLTITWLHPIEEVTWLDCERTLHRWGLEFPTEAQWEFAYRAGTSTRYYTGDDVSSIQGRINGNQMEDRELADDRWHTPAPIGTFAPNPWGLHEIAGNVFEFTRDPYWVERPRELSPGDGLVELGESRLRVNRGGSFASDHVHLAAANRVDTPPNVPQPDQGLRPARRLER